VTEHCCTDLGGHGLVLLGVSARYQRREETVYVVVREVMRCNLGCDTHACSKFKQETTMQASLCDLCCGTYACSLNTRHIRAGTIIEVNVSELGLVTPAGKVVWGKYAQVRGTDLLTCLQEGLSGVGFQGEGAVHATIAVCNHVQVVW
jgi:hypothetical protein